MEQVLSNVDRRSLANLSIPRNVADLTHELRVDRHAWVEDPAADGRLRARTEDEVSDHLHELIKAGLAVEVGDGGDLGAAKLIVGAQAHADAMEVPDEKAEIFARRLDDPSRAWRIDGATYMLTSEGLGMLHAPAPGAPPALTPSAWLASIEREWARVIDLDAAGARYAGSPTDQAGPDGEPWLAGGVLLDASTGKPFEGDAGPSLAQSLLPDEFQHWLGLVLPEYDRLYSDGRRLRRDLSRAGIPLIGGATGWTDAYENSLVDAENQKATLTAAAPWFMALSILAFTDADTGTTADDGSHKPTYTGYARISVAAADMNSAASGSSANANALTGAACTAGSSVILGFGNCSALTVGTLRKYGTCASTSVSTTQTPPTFNVGAYTTTAD